MRFYLEILQHTGTGNTLLNGSILPRHSILIYERPRIQAIHSFQGGRESVHTISMSQFDWVFALNSVDLSKRMPRYFVADWPTNPVGQNHLAKPEVGVHVLVSSDQRGVVWVNDKKGVHQIEASSLPYVFAEGELSVKQSLY